MKARTITAILVAGFLASGTLATAKAGASNTDSQTDFPEAVGEPLGGSSATQFDLTRLSENQKQLHRRLLDDLVEEGLNAPLVIEVTEQDLQRMEQGDASRRKVIVGFTREAAIPVSFVDIPPVQSVYGSGFVDLGAVRIDDAGLTWTGKVHSEGAYALRIHLTDFDLPLGAEFYVFNAEGESFGPYTERGPGGNGDFWSNTVSGDELLLQLVYRGEDLSGALDRTRFTVNAVGHLTEKFGAALNTLKEESGICPQGAGDQSGLCTWGVITNASCVENASCFSGSMPAEVWNAGRNAVASLLYPTWPSLLAICSGGLMNDTDPNSQIPYLLTANHCISNSVEATGLESFFKYHKPCKILGIPWHGPCLSALVDAPLLGRVLGSTLRKTNPVSDYTLLELWYAPLSGGWLLGWTTAPVSGSAGYDLYRVSHPKGAPQAYSEHEVITSWNDCGGEWPRGKWIYSKDVLGATEGGSSGSPVLNFDGLVVGQLSGACGSNLDDVCDNTSNRTVDGAFAAYFEEVREFLHPAPVALCRNVTEEADAVSCTADVSPAQLDNGSYDPNGDPITFSANPESPYALGITPVTLTVEDDGGLTDSCSAKVTVVDATPPVLSTVPDRVAECASPLGTPVNVPEPTAIEHCSPPVTILSDAPALFPLGVTKVTFTATDNAGNQSETETNVTVEDTIPPTVMCNSPATIVPPDAPISFAASADDICQGAVTTVITDFDCFKFTQAGKRIDKTESCVISVDGGTITVEDSGGVGNNITWTVAATDNSGNTTTKACSLVVENPGKGNI